MKAALTTCVAVASVLVACSSGQPAHSPTTSPAGTASVVAVAKKTISFQGVQLSIPALWPVIDAAHMAPSCRSAFSSQSDKAFLGTAEPNGLLGCAYITRSTKVPPADGILMEPIGPATPTRGTPTTLPHGQHVELSFDQWHTTIEFPFHGVGIEIGIGPDPNVERSILDSITYHPGTPDTTTLGTCPTPSSAKPAMPTPTRTTTAINLMDNVTALWPERNNAQPKISAAVAWREYLKQLGVAADAAWPLQWSMTFGFMADQSATAPPHGTPAWLIQALPTNTDHGYCGAHVMVLVNATTGDLIFTESGTP
jgi:hypothetical protein